MKVQSRQANGVRSDRFNSMLESGGLVVWITAGLFLALFGFHMVREYWWFRIHSFDFGIFDQGLWLLSRGLEPFVTVRGLHLFADHSSYIMALLAPFYRLFTSQELLLVFTVAVLAAGGPLVYSLARKLGASQLPALAAGLIYLLHPATSWNAVDNFHPEVLAIPLVIGGFLLIHREREGWGLGLLGLALLAKEDVPLLLIPLGLYLAFVLGRRALGLSVAGVSVVVLVLHLTVLLPFFSTTGELLYAGRYAPFGEGIGGLLVGLVTRPVLLLETAFEPSKLGYVAAMLLPAPLAFLAPRMLVVSVPAFLANMLSTFPYQTEIRWHYTTYILTVVALASAVGAARLSERTDQVNKAAVGSLVIAVVFHVALAPNPVFHPERWGSPHPDHETMQRAVSLIPDGAVVSAFDSFVPHLTHRREIYEFPNPWQDHNYGTPETFPPSPDRVEWVVVRTDTSPSNVELIDELRESDEFDVVYENSPALVLSRRDAGN